MQASNRNPSRGWGSGALRSFNGILRTKGPRFRLAISGRGSENRQHMRCSIVSQGPPPVELLMMMSGQRSRINRFTRE